MSVFDETLDLNIKAVIFLLIRVSWAGHPIRCTNLSSKVAVGRNARGLTLTQTEALSVVLHSAPPRQTARTNTWWTRSVAPDSCWIHWTGKADCASSSSSSSRRTGYSPLVLAPQDSKSFSLFFSVSFHGKHIWRTFFIYFQVIICCSPKLVSILICLGVRKWTLLPLTAAVIHLKADLRQRGFNAFHKYGRCWLLGAHFAWLDIVFFKYIF